VLHPKTLVIALIPEHTHCTELSRVFSVFGAEGSRLRSDGGKYRSLSVQQNLITGACKCRSSIDRVLVSVSTSRSRDGLETYQRWVSVSATYVSCPRPIFGQIVQATVCSVNGL